MDNFLIKTSDVNNNEKRFTNPESFINYMKTFFNVINDPKPLRNIDSLNNAIIFAQSFCPGIQILECVTPLEKLTFEFCVERLHTTWVRTFYDCEAKDFNSALQIFNDGEAKETDSREIGEGEHLEPFENSNLETEEVRLDCSFNRILQTNRKDPEKHINHIIRNLDWSGLAKQKDLLHKASQLPGFDELEGIINIIDSIQDYAVDSMGINEKTVFVNS